MFDPFRNIYRSNILVVHPYNFSMVLLWSNDWLDLYVLDLNLVQVDDLISKLVSSSQLGLLAHQVDKWPPLTFVVALLFPFQHHNPELGLSTKLQHILGHSSLEVCAIRLLPKTSLNFISLTNHF